MKIGIGRSMLFKMTRKQALAHDLLVCGNCGFPQNYHFEFGDHHKCKDYKEVARSSAGRIVKVKKGSVKAGKHGSRHEFLNRCSIYNFSLDRLASAYGVRGSSYEDLADKLQSYVVRDITTWEKLTSTIDYIWVHLTHDERSSLIMTADKPSSQEVVWAEFEGKANANGVIKCKPIALERKPWRVWTLIRNDNKSVVPTLPIIPIHLINAFFEDAGHDWIWKDSQLRYFSRVTSTSIWLLIEYK